MSFAVKQSSGDQPGPRLGRPVEETGGNRRARSGLEFLKSGWGEARIQRVSDASGHRKLRLRLKKRTSINSIPRIHKEKEMADFRKWLYALAMVALIVGLTVPANAQGGVVTCTASTVPTLIRAQAYADLVGDYTLICTGGTPTAAGQVVPPVNIQVFLSTNVTSKLTTASGAFDEALLIIDEPNTPTNPTRKILNCGNSGANDNGNSGPGVCQIVSDGNPADTYDGTPNVMGQFGGGTVNCDGAAGTWPGNAVYAPTNGTRSGDPGANSYGCGHPNIFQGRTAAAQSTGISSSIVFQGVPFDPPGTLTTRFLRITNVRADAEILGVASSFVQQTVTMSVAFTGSQLVTVTNFTAQQTVATILNGLTVTSDGKGDTKYNNLAFLQCNSENPKLFSGSSATGSDVPGGGGYTTQPTVTFVEGFQNAWKTKNIAFMTTGTSTPGNNAVGNGTYTSSGVTYSGTINYPSDVAQNVPGVNYNTESGFEWVGSAAGQGFGSGQPVLNTNPPSGVSTVTVASNGYSLYDQNGTGISSAGQATQGTRLALSFTNIPQGASIFVNPVVLLTNGTATTGVMVLTPTAADGSGAFSAPSGATVAGAVTSLGYTAGAGSVGTNNLVAVSGGLAVYEILFTDPNSVETAQVPVVVAYASNLSSNPPVGLPVPGTATQVAGGFAPFYTSAAARQPSNSLPVPRFIPGATPLNLFEIVKCACDLLFPFTVSNSGFDTGIAIANTSLDPGANFGFGATPQQGTVTFFYFGTGLGGQVAPASQTSGVVPAGQVLTYVLSSGAGSIGTTGPNGLDGRAGTGQFEGYIIAQAGFQYCHGFAFISPLGGGPLSPGVSGGYLALELDKGGLVRTAQTSENLVH